MSTPTDQQIHQLFSQLQALSHRASNDAPTRLELLERRVLNACHRNRTTDTDGVRRRDGYPTGSGPGDGGQDTPDSSTQAAAFANLGDLYDGHPHIAHDPLDDLVTEIHATLTELVGHTNRLDTLLLQVDKTSDPRRTTNPAASCQACGRTVECTAADPIRAGYCSACSSAYYRWRNNELAAGREPDRVRFEHQRRADSHAA